MIIFVLHDTVAASAAGVVVEQLQHVRLDVPRPEHEHRLRGGVKLLVMSHDLGLL